MTFHDLNRAGPLRGNYEEETLIMKCQTLKEKIMFHFINRRERMGVPKAALKLISCHEQASS